MHYNWRVAPTFGNQRKPPRSSKDPAQPKINKQKKFLKKKIFMRVLPKFRDLKHIPVQPGREIFSNLSPWCEFYSFIPA